MRYALIILLLSVITAAQASPPRGSTFQILAYHDVRDAVSEDYDADQYAISTANLIDHFTWLRVNGFHVVSVDDIMCSSASLR